MAFSYIYNVFIKKNLRQSHYVALADLELNYTILKFRDLSAFCLLTSGIKGVCYHKFTF